MDLWDRAIKEEYTGGSSSTYSSGMMASTASPQPMEGLHDPGPPPFLTKTYDIIEDSCTDHIISWSRGNNSFVVWDPQAFSISLLPRYFKHNNFSSFVRQLNTYGFRKVDPDRWEFANEGFLRGQKHLLKTMRRRRAPQTQTSQQALEACVEVGTFRLDEEVDRLSRDKQVLMVELVKLKQQQQTSKACLQLMEQRIKRNENKQQHMMSFLARAMQNPTFVKQLVQQKDMMNGLEGEISKKKRRASYQGRRGNVEVGEFGHGTEGVTAFVKIEPREVGDFSEFEVPEFLNLTMNMQELSESQLINLDEECIEKGEEYENKGKNFDEAFWEDLLNGDIDEQIAILGGEGEGEEDVIM